MEAYYSAFTLVFGQFQWCYFTDICLVKYISLDKVLEMIAWSGQRALLGKMDVKSAFKFTTCAYGFQFTVFFFGSYNMR